MVDAVRTPEAHGSGFLRKWTLANLPIDRSRDFSLMNHWNNGNEFMQALRMTIAELLLRVHRLSDNASYLLRRFDQMRIGKVGVARGGPVPAQGTEPGIVVGEQAHILPKGVGPRRQPKGQITAALA